MHYPTIMLTALLGTSIQAMSVPSLPPLLPNSTAVSPDGYRYIIGARPYITQVSTQQDQSSSQVSPHAQLIDLKPDQVGSYGSVTRANWYGSPQNEDTCGPSYFESRTSNASPLVEDCARMRDYYRTHRGWWEAATVPDFVMAHKGDWTQFVSMGSCALGFQLIGWHACGMKLGNTDISDLVGDAIGRYQNNGRVGAEGTMDCQTLCADPSHGVRWAIFHA